mgnify:FL=1
MGERIQRPIDAAVAALRASSDALPAPARRDAASRAGQTLLAGGEADQPAVELLELLAGDADWAVRLEVARQLHLLEDEACSRIAAALQQDPNSYVRNHAARGLARQRKASRDAHRKRSDGASHGDQIDLLSRQHGKHVARKVMALADQRFAMLADAVGHDVRRILTTLSANVAALEREDGPTDRIASIADDLAFLRHTVEAMEQYSKPVPEQRTPEDLRQMIDQAVEKAMACVVEQGHDPDAVEVAVAEVPAIRPRVARRLIVMALTNVIQNAVESFADRDVDALPAGRVSVEVAVDGYETRIIVRDDGPGMEPEVLAYLERFMPIGPNKAKRSSSGWGLSLVHKYITAHGGDVAISSAIDRGTTIVLALPMRDSAGGDDE